MAQCCHNFCLFFTAGTGSGFLTGLGTGGSRRLLPFSEATFMGRLIHVDRIGSRAASNGDLHFIGNMDILASAILVVAHLNRDLFLFVLGRGRYIQRCHSICNCQCIILRFLLKRRRQFTFTDSQRGQIAVLVVPAAAQVVTHVQRKHDPDHIAVYQFVFRYGYIVKTTVHKPVVQCAHPACTGITACKFRKPIDGSDIVLCSAVFSASFRQSCDNAAHHSRIRINRNLCIYQSAVPRCTFVNTQRCVFYYHTN